jgi:Kef-type K+ transport system membrane component KefB/mannitol/fructose-specific phosphotransferase system IIA component (Ntr-type)
METLSSHTIAVMFLALGVLLLTARGLGELAMRFRQPAVLRELLAGVLLGPTVLGTVAPGLSTLLFPQTGPNALALDAIGSLAIALFLLVAGMEVDLSTVWKQGRTGLLVGIASVAVPFSIALGAALAFPGALGRHPGADPLIFALFLAIAMSISALPIIAKTLMDMNLYRSDFGMVVVSAAILNDLVGWIVFSIILGMIHSSTGQVGSILGTVGLTLAFTGAMLTLGRRLIHRVMPFVQAYTRWPAGELSFALSLGLFGAAFTEWIGIHAIFGAFIVGVAIGDSSHLRERTRVTIENFVSFIFAPVFFAGIGLKVNLAAHFDLPLILTVLGAVFVCKLTGGVLGARWGGMPRREAWGVGFAMVSVGAMGIIVGIIALQAGIIRERLFVALLVMAILTSLVSGPAMRMVLRPDRKRRLREILTARSFHGELHAASRRGVIREMTAALADATGNDPRAIEKAVWAREEALSTGLGNGLALPHARLPGLAAPLVLAGVSPAGIDFDAPDGKPARVIFLVLTPSNEPSAQLEIGAEIARLFRDPRMTEKVLGSRGQTDFLALMQTGI